MMKQKIKDFFLIVWYYLSFPFRWPSYRKSDRKLKQIAAEHRANIMTEKDVEFLKNAGVETDLETLREQSKK